MAENSQILQVVTEAHMDAGDETAVSPIVNVYHYKRQSGLLPASKASFRTKFLTEVLDNLKVCLSANYITDRIRIRWLDDATDPYTDAALSKDGTVPGDSLPAWVAAMVDIKTGIRGPTKRARKFYGPIAESHAEKNSLNATATALWATFCTKLLGPFTDADGEEWRFVAIDFKASDLVMPNASVVWSLCTEAAVKPGLKALRRRLRLK